MATTTYRIRGMDCVEEVSALRKELSALRGIRDLSFDVVNGKMTVQYGDDEIKPADVLAAVGRAGLRAELWRESHGAGDAPALRHHRIRTILTVLSGSFVAAGFISHAIIEGGRAALSGHEGLLMPVVPRLFYLAAVVTGGWYVAPRAWAALKRLRPDMNLLMTVAVLGAIAIGVWFEAATVSFLFALSLTLESWSVARARRAITALLQIAPPKARLIRDNGEETVDVADVAIGSRILVLPGEKVPLDGKVLTGETSIDQAPITGESVPVPKTAGDEVFAGTLNEDGTIEIVTTKSASDTTLARIIRMVTEAQGKRSPSEQWVEQFARFYTPAVMLGAVLVAMVPPLLFGTAWSQWFYRALVLLVIACPCALVISTPVSIVAAIVAAAKQGLLIKGGVFVELPSRIRAIAMDKTGTITAGRPRVQEVVPLSGHTAKELLEIASAIESRSEHPLARAIVQHATMEGINVAPAESFRAVRGRGASSVLGGREFWIGSHRLLEERGQETPEVHDRLEELSLSGSSAVVIGNEEHVCGFIAVGDEIRPETRETVAALKSQAIERVIMLTGDNRGAAAVMALKAGVDEVKAELLPEDKVRAVEELLHRYGQVAMVGDGINDAPALARSSLGIAMGAAGSDAAIETADIALMSDDLGRLPWLIRHSYRTLQIIRQNVVASLGVKGLFVALTFAGYASLWGAIAADMGVSLLVVFNALRLLNGKKSEESGL